MKILDSQQIYINANYLDTKVNEFTFSNNITFYVNFLQIGYFLPLLDQLKNHIKQESTIELQIDKNRQPINSLQTKCENQIKNTIHINQQTIQYRTCIKQLNLLVFKLIINKNTIEKNQQKNRILSFKQFCSTTLFIHQNTSTIFLPSSKISPQIYYSLLQHKFIYQKQNRIQCYLYQNSQTQKLQNYTMQAIESNLQKLLLFVIIGQVSIFALRLYAQVALSLSSALIVFQTILGLIMYCKNTTTIEASIFIVIQIILVYIIIINGIDNIFNPDNASTNNFQNFHSFYEYYGFWIEVPFRLLFILIMWRSFQYSKISELLEIENQQQFDENEI